MCTSEVQQPERKDEAGPSQCEVNLRQVIDAYLDEGDPNLYAEHAFRNEVLVKLLPEEKIRLIFELKERGISQMEKVWKPQLEVHQVETVVDEVTSSTNSNRKKRSLDQGKDEKQTFGVTDYFRKTHIIDAESGSKLQKIVQKKGKWSEKETQFVVDKIVEARKDKRGQQSR